MHISAMVPYLRFIAANSINMGHLKILMLGRKIYKINNNSTSLNVAYQRFLPANSRNIGNLKILRHLEKNIEDKK